MNLSLSDEIYFGCFFTTLASTVLSVWNLSSNKIVTIEIWQIEICGLTRFVRSSSTFMFVVLQNAFTPSTAINTLKLQDRRDMCNRACVSQRPHMDGTNLLYLHCIHNYETIKLIFNTSTFDEFCE